MLQGATVNDADLRIWNYKSGGPFGGRGAKQLVSAPGKLFFRQRPTAPVTVRLPLPLPEGTPLGKTLRGLPQLKDAKGKAKAAPIVLTATDAKVEAAPEQGRTHPARRRSRAPERPRSWCLPRTRSSWPIRR